MHKLQKSIFVFVCSRVPLQVATETTVCHYRNGRYKQDGRLCYFVFYVHKDAQGFT